MVFASFSCALIYLSPVEIFFCERAAQPDVFRSVFDGLWWAVVTLTTVGYSDAIPITAGGKIFTFFVLIIGIGMIAILSGLVASALSKVHDSEQ